MNDPLPASRPPPPTEKRGSLLLGVGCAWATLIVGYAVAAALIGVFSDLSNDAAVLFLLLLPWLGMTALIIWFAMRGRSRSAIGVVIGIASIIAVALLLVAACFGIFAASGFH